MPRFQWKKHPEVSMFLFQLIENTMGSASRPKDYDKILNLMEEEFGTQLCANISPKTIYLRLCDLVRKCSKEENFTTKDLWMQGVKILNSEAMQEVGCDIDSLKQHAESDESTEITSTVPAVPKFMKRPSRKRLISAPGSESKKRVMSVQTSISNSSSTTLSDVPESDEELEQLEDESQDAEEDQRVHQKGNCPNPSGHPDDTPLDRYLNPYLNRAAVDDYVPVQPKNPPEHYDIDKIEATMYDLAKRISQTIDVAIIEQGIDGSQAFHFNESCLSAAGMKTIEKLFGTGWRISDLRAYINEASARRRLTMQIFMAGFVAASVTINALQPLPHGHLDETSVQSDLHCRSMEYLRDNGVECSKLSYKGDLLIETAQSYALQNHILQCVIPKIDENAAALAYELRSQLHAFFNLEAHSYWKPLSSNTVPFEPISVTSQYLMTANCPAPVNIFRTLTNDQLFTNLKDIFKRALTARANWEACGEAKYEFLFPQFRSWYDERVHEANEDCVDPSRHHQIFISTMPGVFARFRDNQAAPWERELRCITRSVVFLMDF